MAVNCALVMNGLAPSPRYRRVTLVHSVPGKAKICFDVPPATIVMVAVAFFSGCCPGCWLWKWSSNCVPGLGEDGDLRNRLHIA